MVFSKNNLLRVRFLDVNNAREIHRVPETVNDSLSLVQLLNV